MVSALDGIKVVDVSQVAAVPMAARHLADFGADVIHVENPATGDYWRIHQPGISKGKDGVPSDINYNWENFNRNKRSITVDLSQPGGQQIIYRLVENSDLFLTNLRPYERERYNLKYDLLSKLNPQLIYGSLTGFGKNGPEKNNPAYDSVAWWAKAGIGHRTRIPGLAPYGFSPAIGDNIAGLALAFGVMMALYVREKTGIGQEVDLSLFHIGVYQFSYDMAGALVTHRDCEEWLVRSPDELPNPLAGYYETKDKRWLLLAMLQSDRYWSRFCQAIEREDLEHDPRFESTDSRTENRVALRRILQEVFLSRTLDEWKKCLDGLPFGPFQNYLEVINDPQARANDFFVPIDHPTHGRMEVVANPVHLSETPATIRTPAPEFGQHTEEVLIEYGYTWENIAQFKEQGIIA